MINVFPNKIGKTLYSSKKSPVTLLGIVCKIPQKICIR